MKYVSFDNNVGEYGVRIWFNLQLSVIGIWLPVMIKLYCVWYTDRKFTSSVSCCIIGFKIWGFNSIITLEKFRSYLDFKLGFNFANLINNYRNYCVILFKILKMKIIYIHFT